MAVVKKYAVIYRNIFSQVWEMNIGQGQVGWEAYKGVRRCSCFLLQEVERYCDAVEKGESAIESRGIVAPRSVINDFALELLSTCHGYRLVPPYELVEVLRCQLGSSFETFAQKEIEQTEKNYRLHSLLRENPDMSDRALARELKIDKSTVALWRRGQFTDKFNEDVYPFNDDYLKIRELIDIDSFFPLKYQRDHQNNK